MKQVICCSEDQKQLQNVEVVGEEGLPSVGQRQQPEGAVGWVEEDLAAFPRSLGSLDFPIKGSHLLKKSLGYQRPEGFTENVKASRTALLH